MDRNRKPYDSILEAIGWTPMVRLSRMSRGLRTAVLGKAENLNPGGSVKDRIGLAIIEAAEKSGALRPGGVIVEGTSGNTGIGLAIAAAIKGYRCIFTIPDKMSSEKIRLLRAYGAEVIVVPTAVPPDHPEYYIQKAKSIVASTPGAILADQHFNPVNPEAHYLSTGPEIWEQTDGRITHFVAGLGTTGTVVGTSRYLHERNPRVQVVAVEPDEPLHGLEGLKHLESAIVPEIWDEKAADRRLHVSTESGLATCAEAMAGSALFIGHSAGAALYAARQLAQELSRGVVVALLCDGGERYASTGAPAR
jgi:cystathionine beta-synthase